MAHEGQTVSYIEVTPADIGLANRLAHQVLGRTLDELPPQTRNLLVLLRDWVQGCCAAQGIEQAQWHFTRRQVREALRWGDTQLKVHLGRLVELEHLGLHRRGLGHEYTLVYDARGDEGGGEGDAGAHFSGLLEVGGHAYDANRSGLEDLRSAPGRPSVGGRSAIGRGGVNGVQTRADACLQADAVLNGRKTHILGRETSPSAAVVVVGADADPVRSH